MIKFLCGRESAEKNERIIELIREGAQSGRRVCVIVPEQQAVIWERRLARSLDPRLAMGLDVVSFTRLADLCERRYGGQSYNFADSGARTLLMWKALASTAPMLKVYNSARNTANIVSAMQAAQKEFARSGITPGDLSETADVLEGEGETPLADRLRDLALVMAEYTASFEGKFDDPDTEGDKLLSLITENPFFEGTDVFIDSFYSLTAVESKIVREIFARADNTVMTFACRDKAEDRDVHLSHIHKFYLSMKESASRLSGFEVEEIISTNAEDLPAYRQREYLRHSLWDFNAPPCEDHGFVRTVRCADRYDEAEAALCRVRELVMEGARYSDIAIIARNTDNLRSGIATAFAEGGVPLSVAVRFSLMDSPLLSFAMNVLNAVRSGYAREDVCALAKSALTSVTEEEAAAFCAYTRVWGITAKSAYGQGEWTMNPDGFASEVSVRGRRELELANSAKAKIEDILAPLTEAFEDECTVSQVLCALWETLARSDVYERLKERGASLFALGYKDEAAFLRRSWDELMGGMDTFAAVLGDMRTDIASFTALFRQVIAERDVGVIPAGIDEVAFGDADRLRVDKAAHVIILGAVEGEFPRTPEETGIFTDADRIRLEGAGLSLSDNVESRAEQELFWFYRAVSLAQESLTVIIPETDASSKTQPSSGVRRIYELFPSLKDEYFSPDDPLCALWRSEDGGRFAFSANAEHPAAVSAIRALVPEISDGMKPLPMWSSVSPEAAEKIFGKDISTTQSRLELFTKCAFAYYCRYVLRLDDREEKHFSPVDVGNYVHFVLEKFFSAGNVWELSPEDRESAVAALCGEYVEKVLGGRVPPGQKYLTDRLERSISLFCRAICEEFAQSEFRPFAMEQRIGIGEDSPPPLVIPFEGGSVRVRGIIDRLDVLRRNGNAYVRVVDYKSGAKKLSEADIRLGINTQLFLYLFAVCSCPPCDFRDRLLGSADTVVPAGAMYFSARPGESVSEIPLSGESGELHAMDSIERSGRFLADAEILRAMEGDLSGRFIPVKAQKSGGFTKNAIAPEGFDSLKETVSSAVSSVAQGMRAGKAEALPLKQGNYILCDNCAMKPICRNVDGKCRKY